MTVAEMRQRMGNAEFVKWGVFYQRRANREKKAARQARRRRR
jgi:hypothetical protein